MPVMPQNAAGMRTEPPVSVPSAPRKSPAATPAPLPEEDPPGHVSGFQGLRGTGNGFDASGMPIANSIVEVLPMITAPAARSRATTGASCPSPHAGSRTIDWAVVGASFVAMMSFTPIGMPWRGPRSMPAAKSASACFAAASAVSVMRVMNTPRRPSR